MARGEGNQPVRKITIVGGGTAGWMTAALLSRLLSKVENKLIESDEIGIIGVGEATIPHIRNYWQLAGLDQFQMIKESKATFKLGIQFVDWGAPGESYVHGFGKIGRDMLWLHPHQLWIAAKERVTATSRATERAARDAYLGVLSEMARVEALKQALESNETSLKATEAGYEVGTRTSVDVLDARRLLVAAQTDYAQSRYTYLQQVIALRAAAGNLDEATLQELNTLLTESVAPAGTQPTP